MNSDTLKLYKNLVWIVGSVSCLVVSSHRYGLWTRNGGENALQTFPLLPEAHSSWVRNSLWHRNVRFYSESAGTFLSPCCSGDFCTIIHAFGLSLCWLVRILRKWWLWLWLVGLNPCRLKFGAPLIDISSLIKKPSGSSGSCQTVRSGVCVVMKAGPFSQLLRSWTTKELMKDVLPDIPKMAKNAQENIQ